MAHRAGLFFASLLYPSRTHGHLGKELYSRCGHLNRSAKRPRAPLRSLRSDLRAVGKPAPEPIPDLAGSPPGRTSLLVSVECTWLPDLESYLREWLRGYIFGPTCTFPVPVSLGRSPSSTAATLFFYSDSGCVRGMLFISASPCISPVRAQVQVTSASTFLLASGGRPMSLPGEQRLVRALHAALCAQCSGEVRVIYKARNIRLRASPARKRGGRRGVGNDATVLVAQMAPPTDVQSVVDFLHLWAAKRQFGGTSAAIDAQGASAVTPTKCGVDVEIRNGGGRRVATVNAVVRERKRAAGGAVMVRVSTDWVGHREVKRVVRSIGKDMQLAFEDCETHLG